MNGSTGILVRIRSPLCGDGVELVAHWETWIDVAVLEDHGGVAEYEIDGAVDVALSVELAKRVRVQCVLVSFEATAVEC